ncbi:MAG TPA: hypothetical protein VIU61_07795 [Kofleriaceae bacterium]
MRRFALLIALVACACSGTIGTETGDDGDDDDMPPPTPKTVDIEGPAVLPHVQRFANAACTDLDTCRISTYNGHSPTAARALDILVSDVYGQVPSDNNALGDTLAEYVLSNQVEHGITYVIWRQRYNDGRGWDPMEDRGSITQNHYDHVHVSFEETAP